MKLTNDKPDTLNVGWELTTTCNYHCWYCPDYFHNGKYRWPDLDSALEFFHELCTRRKHVSVDIQGGEPTLWPGLSDFVFNKPDNLSVEVTTNGSRTVEWWKRHYKKFDQITFSFHPDTADPNHFIDVMNAIADGSVHIHVFLLAVHSHQKKLMKLYEDLEKSNLPLDCNFKILIDRNMDTPSISENNGLYDIEDFKSNKFYRNIMKDTVKPNAAYIDGKKIDFHELKLFNREDFRGWTCKAGITRLYIKANGDIFRASCGNDPKIGNINFDTDVFDLVPTLCKTKVCPCKDDLVIEKWKID